MLFLYLGSTVGLENAGSDALPFCAELIDYKHEYEIIIVIYINE